MSYGLIYTANFDGFNGDQHKLEIYKKDYTGEDTEIICGGGAVRQIWGPDERKPAVRGCNIEVDLLNIEGSFPLSNFYSREDDTFKVIHYKNSQVTFVGFLVADDCSELQVDFTHGISISATDGLGLLKDVPLNQSSKAFVSIGSFPATTYNFTSPNVFTATALNSTLRVGDRFTVGGNTYNIIENNGTTGFYLAETVTTTAPASATIQVYRTLLQGRFSLATVFKWCLAPTNLELNANVYSNVQPEGGAFYRWLDDTFIDTNTWLKNDNSYESCESILKDILETFGCTLFQAKGVWNIVRWNELRYLPDSFLYYIYDEDMAYIDDELMAAPVTIGTGSDIEFGLTESIIRPYKFVQETFNYRQPEDVMRNASFSRLGPLLNEYADGTDTIREYGMQDWDVGYDYNTAGTSYVPSTATRFIRVRYNSFNEEKERYGVVKGATGMFSSRAAAQCYPIEVRRGDRIRMSFDWRTDVSQAGNVNIYFVVFIQTTLSPTPRSLNNRGLNADGTWTYNGSLLSNVPSMDNTNQWHSVSVETDEVPVDGLLVFKLAQAGQNPQGTKETHYRNIRFEIFRSIAGSTEVIGHQHTQTQAAVINNSSAEDIEIDDAPSAPIAGALFLSSFTGTLQDLTTLWTVGGADTPRRLGQLVTRDEMMARFKERLKLDANILYSNLTPLDVILYSQRPGKRFIFGSMEIDYKLNQSLCTLYEQMEDGEDENSLLEDYRFRYLYNTK